MGSPFVLEEAGVWVDVGVLRWVGGTGGVGAVLRVGAVGVLGPEAVEDEGGVTGALGSGGVGVTELRGPGEVEEVVVEGLGGAGGAGLDGESRGVRARVGFRRGTGMRIAAGERGKKEEGEYESLLHGGRRITGRLMNGAE